MLVNFMIIGAQKCGTTSLTEILRNHPSVVGCNPKEPHFFSESTDWRNSLDEYHSLFEQERDVLYFEASTSYTFYPYRNLHIWDDIYEYNPDMKFIYLVRNPFERIVSSYMHAYETGYTDLPLNEAVVEKRFYIDVSRYFSQVYPYIHKFGAECVLLVEFDEFVNHRAKIINKIADFLSIDAKLFPIWENVHSNKSVGGRKIHHKYESPPFYLKAVRKFFPSLWDKIIDNSERAFDAKPQLSQDRKEVVTNFLRLEMIELQKLMNKDLSHWLEETEPLNESLNLSRN